MRKLLLLIAAIIPTVLTGCLSTKSQSTFTPGGGGTVSLSVSPSTTQTVEVNQSLDLAATVVNTGTSNITVNWTVTGAGCSGAACGMITASTQASATAPPATYTAPNALPTPATVTIVATAAADPTKTVSVVVNLLSNVTISPNLAAVQVLQQKNFTATVVGPPSGQAGVTWSLSGPACSGASCGTLSNVTTTSVTYTAPTTAPSTPTATLTATAQFDGSSNTATINIGPSPADKRLSGRYAFVYRGYPKVTTGGTPSVEAGSLLFDGNGNVSGIEDQNDGTTHTQLAVSGSYTVLEADGRGIMTLNAGLVTTLQIVVLSTSDSTVAQTAYITDFGGTVAGSGKMELQQNPSTLTLASLTGGYAVSLRGGSVASAVGRFDLDGTGVVKPTGEIGRSLTDATCPSTPTLDTTYTHFGGTYGPIDTTTGRTTFNFTAAQIGATKNLALTFAGYIVSPTEVLLVETDTTGFSFLGRAEQQNPTPPSFTNGSFLGVYSYLMQSNNGRGTGNTSLGPADSNGTGAIVDFQFFGNANGVVANPATGFQESSGDYAIQTSGAGTGIFCGGTVAGQVPTSNFALYMVSGSKMLAWNADQDTLGEIDLQAGGPFTSLSGTYAFEFEGVQGTFTGTHTATNAIAESGVVTFVSIGSGTGTATFTIDETNVSSPPTTKTLNASYTISTASNDPDGDGDPGSDNDSWGTLVFTSPPFPLPDRFVVVTGNKIFFTHNATDSNIAGVAETQ
jgi:hypothetical protein